MNKILYLLFLYFSLCSTHTNADNIKRQLLDGFVVTAVGDTIKGKVKFVNRIHNEYKVNFVDKKGKKHLYRPNDLIEYAFNYGNKNDPNSWVHYFRKRIEDVPVAGRLTYKTIFLQRVVHGKVTVYLSFSKTNSKIAYGTQRRVYYIENGHKGGGFEKITRTAFKEYMQELVAANEKLKEKVGTTGYGYKYIPKIVQLHNQEVLGN